MSSEAFLRRLAGVYSQRVFWEPEHVSRIARQHHVTRFDFNDLPIPRRHAGGVDLMVKEVSTVGSTFHFIGSTGDVDRMGDRIFVDGWKLGAYMKNPVVLWAHLSDTLPVGKTLRVGPNQDRTALTFDVKFAKTKMGRAVAAMIKGDFLKATSVGMSPGKFEFSRDPTRKGGIDFISGHELWELSIVPVPANPHALLTHISGTDGKAYRPEAKKQRERYLEIAKLRHLLTPKEQRALDVARARRG
jgi:HK97 family phage prohead protease